MPDADRERYLAELDGLLPMPDGRRSEILEEIDAHLDDAVADSLERDIPADRAEEAAQARLGTARDLARELARPEQSAWRVFAGVGAALRSGIGNWIYGYLLGALLVFAGALGLTAFVQAAGIVLDTGWTLQFSDQGWNSMLSTMAGGMGLYWAGRVLPDRVGHATRRLAQDVRPWVVAIATVLVLAFTTLAVDAPQNWASVVALVAAPAAFAVGAYRPSLLPGRVRLSAVTIVLAFLVLGILGVSVASSGLRSGGPVEIPDFPDRGLGIVGPEWHPVVNEPALWSSSWGEAGDATRWDGELAPGVSIAAFDDVRIEGWRTTDDGMRLDPAFDEPFATATVRRDGRSLSADIDLTSVPGVVHWDLILTGVRDGTRHVIDASSGGTSTFTGSVWDWMVAVARDR